MSRPAAPQVVAVVAVAAAALSKSASKLKLTVKAKPSAQAGGFLSLGCKNSNVLAFIYKI